MRSEPNPAPAGDGALPDVANVLRAAFERADGWFAAARGLFDWPAELPIEQRDLAEHVARLQYHNHQVWHYEDLGRTDDDEQILIGWRGAMRHNKFRNQCINAIDAVMAPFGRDDAPLHSESLGALLDRITILHLKYRNFEPRCAATAATVCAQRDELVDYAANLQRELCAGALRCQRVPRLKLYLTESPTTSC